MASIETSVLAHRKCNACNWYSPNTNENHREIARDREREREKQDDDNEITNTMAQSK